MSNYIINRTGVDLVEIEFVQTGREDTSVTLNNDLLDGEKKYNFCVDSWNIPLNNTPLNRYRGQTLFTVFRRNVGTILETQSNIGVAGTAGIPYVLQQDFLDVQSFVASLNNYARGFRAHFEAGLADMRLFGGAADADSSANSIVAPLEVVDTTTEEWFNFSLDLEGRLELQATTNFLNNFIIRFTKIGSELLSFVEHLTTVTHSIVNEDAGGFLVVDADFLYFAPSVNNFVGVDFEILVAGNTRSKISKSKLSLYSTFDCRLKCSLESHLPTQSNVFVEDGKQKNSRHICEVYFDKVLTTTLDVDEAEIKISSKCYSGQYPLVKKSQVYKQWNKLTMSYGLRFFRFHNFVTYREFDSTKNLWVFKRYPLKVDDNNYVDFTLRFISES